MTATKRRVNFSLADVREHLSYVWGSEKGYRAVDLLNRATGRWTRRFHRSTRTVYADVAEVLASGDPIEVFYCPLPMSLPDRSAGNSASRRVVWADADNGLPDPLRDTLRTWGFRIVASGTPGRFHVYARLSRDVSLAEHRAIQDALCELVGGDPAVKADNALMRLPGTWNNKHEHPDPRKRNDRPYPVEVVYSSRRTVDADRLMRRLNINEVKPVRKQRLHEFDDVPVPTPLPTRVRKFVREKSEGEGTGRHRRCMAAVATTIEAGYTRDQVWAILKNFDPGVDKAMDEGGEHRWERDVARLWDKCMAEYDAEKFVMVGSVDDGTAVLRKRDEASVQAWTGAEAFWDRRPLLRHIFNYAKANRLGEWGLLLAVIVRAAYTVPPTIVLPDGGTFNIFVGLVGPVGTNKGRTMRHAALAVDVAWSTPIETVSAGSGQAISHLFMKRNKDGVVERVSTTALYEIPEVDKYIKLSEGHGSTLDPELRSAFSGEALGGFYVDETKRLHVPAHTYRLGVLMGIQPEQADKLFTRASGGTPQRFVWVPVYDEHAPDDRPVYDAPPFAWACPEFNGEVSLPGSVRVELDAGQLRRLRAGIDGSNLEGHTEYVRLKLAGMFALLDNRTAVNDQDWELSGVVMAVSDRTRDAVQQRLSQVQARVQVARGRAEGRRRAAADQVSEALNVKKVAERIMKRWGVGETFTGADVTRHFRGPVNEAHREAALEWLVSEGRLVAQAVKSGASVGFRYTVQ